jgi:hypothetical protein
MHRRRTMKEDLRRMLKTGRMKGMEGDLRTVDWVAWSHGYSKSVSFSFVDRSFWTNKGYDPTIGILDINGASYVCQV